MKADVDVSQRLGSLPYSFTLPLPVELHTSNSHVNRWTRHRMVTALRTDMKALSASQRAEFQLDIAPQQKRTLRITLVRGHGQRLLDKEQLYTALKPVVDGLRDAGWIWNDSPNWVDYDADQVKDNAVGPAAIVHVWDRA